MAAVSLHVYLSHMRHQEFSEVQRFKAWWLYVLTFSLVALSVGIAVYQVTFDIPVGDNPMSNVGVVIVAIVIVLMVLAILSLRLRTRFDAHGVVLSFKPLTQRKVSWDQVDRLEMVDYGFVGYGIRWSRTYDVVYNAHGRIGLLLYLKNGRKLCIGTQKADELEIFLRELVPEKWLSIPA